MANKKATTEIIPTLAEATAFPKKKRILVTPLDWGLGHATRCVPIIRELLDQGFEVLLAGNGQSLRLLELEFPNLPTYALPAYHVRYPTDSMVRNIALQLPHLVRVMAQEHQAVRRLVKEGSIHGIISDNRYGCFHTGIPSVLISHQVNPIVPIHLLRPGLHGFIHMLIDRFDECWIPDWPTPSTSLAGTLAHPPRPNCRFIGPLSRLEGSVGASNSHYRALFLLSGPEPQRTRLEEILRHQVAALPGDFLLVQGLPYQADQAATQIGNLTIIPYLNAPELSAAITASDTILCRAGYSTIMDLVFFGKRALFVPTPGQTEQEYLAEQLHAKGLAFATNQQELDLVQMLPAAEATQGLPRYAPLQGQDLLRQTIAGFVERIRMEH
ncbi:MAG: glycosyltransferase [Lewinellaceae bacterium]|nr:glycosyltransferase [Lewinellaceae bacterium]